MTTEDRSSSVDYEDCDQCVPDRPGVCSNCEADGGFCAECDSTGRCAYCQGTNRKKIELDPEYVRQVQEAGPLIAPDETKEETA